MSFLNKFDEFDFELDALVEVLKLAAEPSRLRILKLLAACDLTVSDLTTILGQSQPRVSRHLKLLGEENLVHRWQEGSWAHFRLETGTAEGALVAALLGRLDENDPVLARDGERLSTVKEQHRAKASQYFSANAESWDKIRSMHAPDAQVEAALIEAVGEGPFSAMLDIGTGTGRMLQLFAPFYRSALGIDSNRDMLSVARANIEAAQLVNADIRLGDIHNLAGDKGGFDLVIIHQVLHFLDDPGDAISQAARHLAPGGKLAIVDFAAHDQEFLRTEHAHRRLGFKDEAIAQWCTRVGLETPAITSVISDSGDVTASPLVVKIWVARDPRLLVADSQKPHNLGKA